jgi:hypothetical protein
MAANEVESTDHVLFYRGYTIEPCHGEEQVDWIYASEFHLFHPGDFEDNRDPFDVTSTLNDAKAAINRDIEQYV